MQICETINQITPMETLEIIFYIILVLVGIEKLLLLLYIPTIRKSLKITHEYHQIKADSAWLILIPVLGTIWHFICVSNVTKGIKGYMSEGGGFYRGDTGYSTGLTSCILFAGIFVPGFNILCFILALSFFLIYWAKIYQSNQVLSPPASKGQSQVIIELRCRECNALYKVEDLINGLCAKCGICSTCGARKNYERKRNSLVISCPNCDMAYCNNCGKKQTFYHTVHEWKDELERRCAVCNEYV
jgi:hypothetical protein